ncbi:MAG: cytochrome-c oxidase, cbb3-type subunit III [Azospirillaceae bacterium]|nr:cytochrome-c oxidase, cbb3-type subunit III [Azospirillaceae bacterium]
MPTKNEKDALSGVYTTGHEWDGISELNNPLPRWWLYVFYACIAWAVVYLVLYPGVPLGKTYWHGLLGWSMRAESARDLEAASQQQAGLRTQLVAASYDQIKASPDLLNFALAGGKIAFAQNCAACHGAGGQGARGFPNLTDDKWIFGGKYEDILNTVTHGAHNSDPDGHSLFMPAWIEDSAPTKLTMAQVGDVAEYVLSINKRSTDAAAATRGQQIFADNCVACHGSNAEGNQDMGAPALNDNNWLYGGDKATLVTTISRGRGGVMPNWGARLDAATIKSVALYVHELGGGK